MCKKMNWIILKVSLSKISQNHNLVVALLGSRDNIFEHQFFFLIKQDRNLKTKITKAWLEYLVFQTKYFDTLSEKSIEIFIQLQYIFIYILATVFCMKAIYCNFSFLEKKKNFDFLEAQLIMGKSCCFLLKLNLYIMQDVFSVQNSYLLIIVAFSSVPHGYYLFSCCQREDFFFTSLKVSINVSKVPSYKM